MKRTFAAWADERATTLATNARGRYVHAIRAKDEVPKVQAAIKHELHEAFLRGVYSAWVVAGAVCLVGAVGATLILRALGAC